MQYRAAWQEGRGWRGLTVDGHDNGEVHDSTHDLLDILEEVDAISESHALSVFVVTSSGDHKASLLFCKPACFLREVTDQEEGRNSNEDRQDALEDENPLPVMQTSDTFHVGNSTGKQTTEGSGGDDGAPVHGHPGLGLFTLVPDGDQVETWKGVS